jgi:ABC-type glycerol-3-phosphate transport system permease component
VAGERAQETERQPASANAAVAFYAAGDVWPVVEFTYLDGGGELVFPHALPAQWGLKYWYQVFSPYSDVSGSLLTSVLIAVLSVAVCLLISVPAGYALSDAGCRCGCCLCCCF